MISKDLPRPLQWVGAQMQTPESRAAGGRREQEHEATISRLVPSWMACSDPLDAVAYDPYNTGAFRVLAERPRRRTLDDMRKLDVEIKQARKPWW